MMTNKYTKAEFGVRTDGSIWMSLAGNTGDHQQFEYFGNAESAESIVKAANAHEALVEALEEISRHPYWEGDPELYAEGMQRRYNKVISIADTAIALAKGEAS